ncbi:MAG: response regulator [Saccharospirillaceae bacterium]|nr:response regulator [Pseudomonadales bacterium]NRB77085.1 response regulator [Saccharospirillaceae bacterium]
MANILAVDDQTSIRQLVKYILELDGHTITLAQDGQEALDFAKEQNFDLVISDVNMPGMTGINMVSKMRRMEQYQGTPILMLTTETSDYKKSKARNSGASGWLSKPFDPPRLSSAVSKLLH